MELVKGKSLVNGWRSRTAESQATILRQLRSMLDTLRSIVPLSDVVSNVDGGPLIDYRLPKSIFGPFDNIDAFHRHLRADLEETNEKLPAVVNELITLHQAQQWSRPVFTHADLSSLNIIAEGDTVTGIVDWETAGWYPFYWEYTMATYVNPWNEFWRPEVDRFLTPYPKELHMEELRRIYFGDT